MTDVFLTVVWIMVLLITGWFSGLLVVGIFGAIMRWGATTDVITVEELDEEIDKHDRGCSL